MVFFGKNEAVVKIKGMFGFLEMLDVPIVIITVAFISLVGFVETAFMFAFSSLFLSSAVLPVWPM